MGGEEAAPGGMCRGLEERLGAGVGNGESSGGGGWLRNWGDKKLRDKEVSAPSRVLRGLLCGMGLG